MKEQPDGIIVTVSRSMYAANGYGHWLRNFKAARPLLDSSLLFVYLCIGNEIRYRGYYGGVRETPEGFKTFDDGRTIKGRFWVLISGPIEAAQRPRIKRQGFQGFRYTQKLF